MTVTHNEIVQACEPVLKNAHFHRNSSERGFLTAYQIWHLLLEINPDFCEHLVSVCGPAIGKGGGDQDGPAKRIANALGAVGQSNIIETLYIDTSKALFGDVNNGIFCASGSTCGIFRWR